jgi:hypothetical protein
VCKTAQDIRKTMIISLARIPLSLVLERWIEKEKESTMKRSNLTKIKG